MAQLSAVVDTLPSTVKTVVDEEVGGFVIMGGPGATADTVNEALRITSASGLFLGNPRDLDAAMDRYDPEGDRDRGR